MINWNKFQEAVVEVLERDITREGNLGHHNAIRSPPNASLFIVAGPGSGKTTALALRALKLIYVDGVNPANILATTFTKKAAKELTSRILGWGDQLRNVFSEDSDLDDLQDELDHLYLNQITVDTLDSIAEEALRESRMPGTPPPVVVENFVSKAIMTKFAILNHGRHNSDDLEDYIRYLRGATWGEMNVRILSSNILDIKDRVVHDMIDLDEYSQNAEHPGASIVCDTIEDYNNELERRLLYDFSRLEKEFLERIEDGTLDRFLQQTHFVLVDEYQDTNPLQEQIYFRLAEAAIHNEGSITVVGDDDQSLYRFRGATVDLFRRFQQSIEQDLGLHTDTIYLAQNYRSSPNIVNFCNEFINLDTPFQDARVQKPSINHARLDDHVNYPILGMFREDTETLARDLSNFIYDIVHGDGRVVCDGDDEFNISIEEGGSAADIALLCSSPKETKRDGTPRLPGLLRRALSRTDPPIPVFNPRGQSLERIPEVQILCGLLLECLDPGESAQDSIDRLPHTARDIFGTWRLRANEYIESSPSPRNPLSLEDFVEAWRSRSPTRRGVDWSGPNGRREVRIVDLIYDLLTWLPRMQDDIENVVYLEAINRAVTQTAIYGQFGSKIIFSEHRPELEELSIREAFWNIFVPISTGIIEVNEDLFETLPRDRLNIMSIHQAKGLEFPLVIIDVGSDFNTEHYRQAFKRFPRVSNDGRVEYISCVNRENELRRFSSQVSVPDRAPIDRAFDDLIRHYFVGYSRAKDALLLVGQHSVRDGYNTSGGTYKTIPNVATGWDRERNWIWGEGLNEILQI